MFIVSKICSCHRLWKILLVGSIVNNNSRFVQPRKLTIVQPETMNANGRGRFISTQLVRCYVYEMVHESR